MNRPAPTKILHCSSPFEYASANWLKPAILFWDSVIIVDYKCPDSSGALEVRNSEYNELDGTDILYSIPINRDGTLPANSNFKIFPLAYDDFAAYHITSGTPLVEDVIRAATELSLIKNGNHDSVDLFWYCMGRKYCEILTILISESSGIPLLSSAPQKYSSTVYSISENYEWSSASSEYEKYSDEVYKSILKDVKNPHNDITTNNNINANQGILLDLIVDDLHIAPDTPFHKLLKFKQQHRDELGLFRTKLSEMTAKIPIDQPIDYIKNDAHNLYINEFMPAYNNFKKH